MTYGKYVFGISPYAGTSVESGEVSLVSDTTPAPNAMDVLGSALVFIDLFSAAEFEPYSLQLHLNGVQVIWNSTFVAPYAGVIEGESTNLTISIPTHPDFSDNSTIPVVISVKTLAGNTANLSYSFHTVVSGSTVNVSEALIQGEALTTEVDNDAQVSDTLSLSDVLEVFRLAFDSLTDTTIGVFFAKPVSIDGLMGPNTYRVIPMSNGVPAQVSPLSIMQSTLGQGASGQVLGSGPLSNLFDIGPGGPLVSVGDYLSITGSYFNPSTLYRIISVAGSILTLNQSILATDPLNGSLEWVLSSPASGVVLSCNQLTIGELYQGSVFNVTDSATQITFSDSARFFAGGTLPRLIGAIFVPENGTVISSFNKDMRLDKALTDPSEYNITGPTSVSIRSVSSVDSKTVALHTSNIEGGSYTLEVNATGTPKDIAGNPTDPLYNIAIFTASIPILTRSIFTDRGPIAKPNLTIQSGVGGTIQTNPSTFFGSITLNEIVLPGGAFTTSHVGLYLELDGTSVNGGSYQITGVVNSTRVKVRASFHLPDPSNGSISWSLCDPRTGEIADDPSDVVVRINGVQTSVQAVIGLLGQIILDSPPAPGSDVKVAYAWIPDPTVEIRRLNSKEFRLNGWSRDNGDVTGSQHAYRYRNVLTTPSTYNPNDLLSSQVQPLLRAMHYRAYERAYSATLNDPNLLVLNTPIHRIAFPPLSREVPGVSVSYLADTLPEVDPTSPWVRNGTGTDTLVSGALLVQKTTSGPPPVGQPFFWTREVDLTFPSVYAATWRMLINTVTPDGVNTGVAVGWSDNTRAVILGYLLDNGVRKIGFLKNGMGNRQSTLAAWTGGLDSGGSPTGLPFVFDWSVLHSYRFFKDQSGVVQFFVDGEVVASLQITENEMPFLEELDDSFDEVQNVFFGSLSRVATNTSTWDFVQYLVQPVNPAQSAPYVSVSYEGNTYPEFALSPWTLVGYHGNESIQNSTLLLDSTSSTTSTDEGLVGGDFRGFTRIEPLLSGSSNVLLDLEVALRTYTHGISPDSVMAAIDDGSRLVQLCFFPTKPQPKFSYPGRTFPQDATPNPWAVLGSATTTMVGRILRVDDASITSGVVYAINDLEPSGSDNRILEASIDWFAEFKSQVLSYTADGTPDNFCGMTVDVFDGTRVLGVMARKDTTTGVLQIAFHSDGHIRPGVSAFTFNWMDGQTHVYRLAKSTTGDLVSLFIDNKLIGTYSYSGFQAESGVPTYSFGSATAISQSSLSSVEWHYVNVWRAQPTSGVRRYLGVWKGTDSETLRDYHLPLKVTGTASTIGNVLTDTLGDFVASGVQVGDDLVVDVGVNQGVFSIISVTSTVITILGSFPQTGSTLTTYRIPSQTDWTTSHKYRVVRDPGGFIAVTQDSNSEPLIQIDYNEINLPASSTGIPNLINRGLASISWGSFDPKNLSQTAWGFVHYLIAKSPDGSKIVPHHQVLNQRNIMSSPEHLFGTVPHNHTQYSSSSTGVPYPWEDYSSNPLVGAFTNLNEGTPLVPQTQSYEVRSPHPQVTYLSTLNNPADLLNSQGFQLNDATSEVKIVVPDDVLYSSIEVLEQDSGDVGLIAPFSDESGLVSLGTLSWQKTICATYNGTVLPEQDPNFGTPWVLSSDDPSQVSTTISGGILTYAVGATPTQTLYRNATPLTDPIGLSSKVDFNLRLLGDSTLGTGDSGVRFGFSAFGLTAALAFVATPLGEREVQLVDLNTEEVLGAISFDYLDGSFHTYRLIKDVVSQSLDLFIDP